jgi:hypothetical protein
MLPNILPDEFLLGYLGRISAVNNKISISNIKNILRNWFSEAKPEIKAPPFIVVLAHALELDISSIVKKHTLSPILRSTRPETINFPVEFGVRSSYEFDLLKRIGLVIPKKVACFCESCVIEDKDNQRVSFWRRSHQIPGIDWCSKHMEALQEVHDENAFYRQPGFFLNSGNYCKQSESLGIKDSIILRFAQLTEYALELEVPINNITAQEVLTNKARSIGVRFSEMGVSRQLSDLMNEVLPEQWMVKYFPRLKKESYGKFVAGFDEVLKPSRKVKSYVNTLLAAAVLFDDPDEAMHELIAQNLHLLNKTNKQEISDVTFINAYVRHRGSYLKMGLEFEKDRRSIFSRARWLGLPSLSEVDTDTFNAIKDFYDGSNLVEILARPNINKEKFANIIRLSGRQFSSTIKKIDSIDQV